MQANVGRRGGERCTLRNHEADLVRRSGRTIHGFDEIQPRDPRTEFKPSDHGCFTKMLHESGTNQDQIITKAPPLIPTGSGDAREAVAELRRPWPKRIDSPRWLPEAE